MKLTSYIFIFVQNFKTKRVNQAVIHVFYLLKLKLRLRNDPVSVFFIMQLGHTCCLSTIEFILDIYL